LKGYFVIFWIFYTLLTFSQSIKPTYLKIKKIKVYQAKIQIDTFSIQPIYFKVFDSDSIPVPPSSYHINFAKALLILKKLKNYKNHVLSIHYLIYPEYLHRTYQRYDAQAILKDSMHNLTLLPKKTYQSKPFEGLETQGSITRGFNAGNQQSLVMQSGLDLKIEGKLSPKLKVKAVLSDDNMPQAYAGISQSYKEFNRIYLQLEAPNWQATGGDLLWQEQASYFLKFRRKSQGLDIRIARDSSAWQIAGGFVQGQFGRNRFNGIEGNQGPYALKGNKGEAYIFIIPNSEKVYVNGKLLQAGSDKDYTINYETAEIRFNPTFPITQNQRIVAEFNYSNQHYVRYLNYNRYQHQGKKSDWSTYTFLEQDAKSQTLLYDLNREQIQILKNAGNRPDALFVIAATSTSYNENKILYQKISTGQGYYFEYTNEDRSDLYEVRFSYVGPHKGSYQIKKITAIGKIFEYVGAGLGDYEPKIRLTPPISRKYAGLNYYWHPNEETDFEWAGILNYNDNNLFSSIDDQNNLGGALHLSLKQTIWQKHEKNFSLTGLYDYTNQNFVPLDPYRSVEFNRQWQIDSLFGRQHLADVSLQYQNKENFITGGWRFFKLQDILKAHQAYAKSEWHYKHWDNISMYQYTAQKSNFDLQAADLTQKLIYHFTHFDWSVRAHFENRNKRSENNLDSLNYRYAYGELQWQKKDTLQTGWRLFYRHEQNDSIKQQQWQTVDQIDNLGGQWQHKGKKHALKIFLQYRHHKTLQTNLIKDFLNARLSWHQSFLNRLMTTQLRLESYNGNTLRDDIIFVETPPGQGLYQWNDYNENGVKEINEFEIAIYKDQANYIRVILPAKNYVPTLNNSYHFQLNINPGVWQKKSFLKNIYGILIFENKHQSEQNNQSTFLVWQPKHVLSQNMLWQQDWFFNRTKKHFNIHFTYQFVKQLQWLSVGIQQQILEDYRLKLKHALTNYLLWQQKASYSQIKHLSENYIQKNYNLKTDNFEQGLIWHQKQQKRFYIFYNYKHKINLSGNENLKMHKFGLRYQYTDAKQNMFTFDLQYIKNVMQAPAYSPVAFQMLEGLQAGKNLVLETLYKQRINSYLQLYLNYTFRISETHSAIHTGGIQLKMVF